MAKKDKDPTPNPASIPNKDIIQRLNFLYQASVYLSNLSRDVPPTDVPHPGSSAISAREEDQAHSKTSNLKSRHAKQSRRRSRTTDELSRAYVHTMTMVGKRATVKMCVSASNVELDADLFIYPTSSYARVPKTQHRDPSIKRTLCKSCKSVLVPGINVIIRVKREYPLPHLRSPFSVSFLCLIILSDMGYVVLGSSSHKHALVLKCMKCGYARRMPAPERKGWDGRGRWDVGDGEVDVEAVVVTEKETEKEENSTDHTTVSNPTENEEHKKSTKKHEKKRAYPPLPLSARRDAGHVVFRGDEKVEIGMEEINQVGDGVFAV